MLCSLFGKEESKEVRALVNQDTRWFIPRKEGHWKMFLVKSFLFWNIKILGSSDFKVFQEVFLCKITHKAHIFCVLWKLTINGSLSHAMNDSVFMDREELNNHFHIVTPRKATRERNLRASNNVIADSTMQIHFRRTEKRDFLLRL
jgi:hypothetical protein